MTVHHFTFQRKAHGDDVIEIGRVLDNLAAEGREVVSMSHFVEKITFVDTHVYVDVLVVTRESGNTYERDLISRMEDWLGVNEGYIDEHEDEYRALQREVRDYLRGNE
jgi:hypothetical protein